MTTSRMAVILSSAVVGIDLAIVGILIILKPSSQEYFAKSPLLLGLWMLLLLWCIVEAIRLLQIHRRSVFTSHIASDSTRVTGVPSSRFDSKIIKWLLTIVVVVLACVSFKSLFSSSPLNYADWNNLGSQRYLASAFPYQSAWSFGAFGQFSASALRLVLPTSVVAAFAKLGMTFTLSERMVYIIPFIVFSIFGVRRLVSRATDDILLQSTASLLYTVNFVTVNWYAGGWFPILLAYSLVPWQLNEYLEWRIHRDWKPVIVSALIMGVIVSLDPRLAIITVIPLGLFMIIDAIRVRYREFPLILFKQPYCVYLVQGSVALLFVILIISPVIGLQYKFAGSALVLPNGYYSVSNLTRFSFYNIVDTLNFFDPWWPRFDFFFTATQSAVPVVTLVLSFLLLLGILRRQLNLQSRMFRWVGVSCLTLGVAFVSGANFPIPQLNTFLWINVPGFDLFRNPELWNPLIAIGVILLSVGVASDIKGATGRISSFQWRWVRASVLRRALPIVFSIIVLMQVIVIVRGANQYSALNLNSSSFATARSRSLQSFESDHSGYLLWLPVAPVETTDASVSSRDLGLIATAPKSGVTNLSAIQYDTSNTLLSNNSLSWLSLPVVDLNSLFRRRDIGYLGVDTSVTAWSSPSLLPQRRVVIGRLNELHLPVVYVGKNIVIYRVGSSSLLDSSAALKSQSRRFVKTTRLVGARDFGAVGNVDNYASLNARKAGLYRRVVRCAITGLTRCLEIGIRVGGAAVVSRSPLSEIISGEVVSVRVLSKGGDRLSSGDGAKEEIVFRCNGATYARNFATPSRGFRIDHLGFQYIGGTACFDPGVEVVLLSPGAVGIASKRVSSSVVLVDATVLVSNPVGGALSADNTYNGGHGQSWYAPYYQSKKLGSLVGTQQDEWSVWLPQSRSIRAIDLWTNFSPLWIMSCANGEKVTHTILDGWANGFVVGPGSGSSCIVRFIPQHFFNAATIVAGFVVIAGILVTGLLSLRRRRRRRRWRRSVDSL